MRVYLINSQANNVHGLTLFAVPLQSLTQGIVNRELGMLNYEFGNGLLFKE